jgi:flagellar biosynthetic protein FliQ
MNAAELPELLRQALMLVVLLAAPTLLAGLAVALVVSAIQAATQVQEHTLSFVPKILAMLAMVLITGGWMLQRLMDFCETAFSALP